MRSERVYAENFHRHPGRKIAFVVYETGEVTAALACAGPTGKHVFRSVVLGPPTEVVMCSRNTRFRLLRNGGGDNMNFHLFDLAGFIGVILIIVAYLLLQLEKLPSSSPRYSLLNAAGALLIMVSLIFAFNLSAFIVEAFWFLISLVGLWRSLSARKDSKRG